MGALAPFLMQVDPPMGAGGYGNGGGGAGAGGGARQEKADTSQADTIEIIKNYEIW